MSYVLQAVGLCRNASFHRWIEKRLQGNWGPVDEAFAANFIREYCHIKSRSELATNVKACALFRLLMREFQTREDLPHVANA
jgi:hypothetical protein